MQRDEVVVWVTIRSNGSGSGSNPGKPIRQDPPRQPPSLLLSLSLSLFLSICDCPPLRDGTCNGSSTPCSWAELREIPLNLRVCLPLAAIAPAGSNPAVLVLELRFEALRTALNDYSRMITDDFRTDVTAAKLAEMGMGK